MTINVPQPRLFPRGAKCMPVSESLSEASITGQIDTYSVSLIDRRTGAAHRVNGSPLTVMTVRPEQAAQEMLRARDPSLWDIRIRRMATRTLS